MKKTLFAFLAGIMIVPLLVSCSSAGPDKVSALVSMQGKPRGMIVKYKTAIDKYSVEKGTYEIRGQEVSKVFVSDVNPFSKEDSPAIRTENPLKGKGGRYAVILLKNDPSAPVDLDIKTIDIASIPKVDIRVRQVADIKTLEGKTVKAWKKPVKAEEQFPMR